MDGALLGFFMISACVSVTLLEHPASPLREHLASDFLRRALVGLAMGVTAVVLIYSPWGKRSGALMNPAMTLAFVRLGKLEPWAALGYIVAQLAGGTAGVFVSALALGSALGDPAVNYVVTAPGGYGVAAAWLGEFAIAFTLLSVVVLVNRVPRLAAHAGWFAAALVALFITFEAPLSGMSLNPARSFASAAVAGAWHGFWIYLTAPVAGVLAAVEVLRSFGPHRALCGKPSHDPSITCFLRCNCLARSGSPSS
jgi:aquaporin Z